jgi:hypothetical protein
MIVNDGIGKKSAKDSIALAAIPGEVGMSWITVRTPAASSATTGGAGETAIQKASPAALRSATGAKVASETVAAVPRGTGTVKNKLLPRRKPRKKRKLCTLAAKREKSRRTSRLMYVAVIGNSTMPGWMGDWHFHLHGLDYIGVCICFHIRSTQVALFE